MTDQIVGPHVPNRLACAQAQGHDQQHDTADLPKVRCHGASSSCPLGYGFAVLAVSLMNPSSAMAGNNERTDQNILPGSDTSEAHVASYTLTFCVMAWF